MPQRPDTPRQRRIRPWTFASAALAITIMVCAALVYFRVNAGIADDAQRRDQIESLGSLVADANTILGYAQRNEWMTFVEPTYRQHCATCHGLRGQGMSAPNLTDDRYISVIQVEDIHDIIAHGQNHGAMPAWENLLHPNEVILLSSYVVSLRGRDLPGRPVDQRAVQIPDWSMGSEPNADTGTELPTPVER